MIDNKQLNNFDYGKDIAVNYRSCHSVSYL